MSILIFLRTDYHDTFHRARPQVYKRRGKKRYGVSIYIKKIGKCTKKNTKSKETALLLVFCISFQMYFKVSNYIKLTISIVSRTTSSLNLQFSRRSSIAPFVFFTPFVDIPHCFKNFIPVIMSGRSNISSAFSMLKLPDILAIMFLTS